MIAGYQVNVRGRRYFDGGVSQHLAIEFAVAAGATHIVVLMTRSEDQLVRPAKQRLISLDRVALEVAYGAKIRAMFDERNKILNESIASTEVGYLVPHVRICRIARNAGGTSLGRLTTNDVMLRSAAKEAREAVLQALACTETIKDQR